MKKILETYPFFLALLPLFIVVHIEKMYHGLIDYNLVFGDILFLLAAPVVAYPVCWLLMRRQRKAAIATICVLITFYFFGEIKDALKAAFPGSVWQSYTLLLTLTTAVVTLLLLYIHRSRAVFKKTYLFFNAALLLFIGADTASIITAAGAQRNKSLASPLPAIDSNSVKPDIYYIIFDSYTSTRTLKDHFSFNNARIDSALVQRGFRIIPGSQSNYNLTPFSVGSTFQLNFLPDVDTGADYYMKNYLPGLRYIRENPFVPWLEKAGYKIYNHSLFNLCDHPTTVPPFDIWKLRTLYQQHNLLKKMNNDIGWQFPAWMQGSERSLSAYAAARDRHDSIALAHMLHTISLSSDKPRFVYGHLFIPHSPYTFDSTGKKIAVADYASIEEDKQAYVQQITHVNRVMLQLADAILASASRPVAIIIQGDHGYRFFDAARKQLEFPNFNAMYFSNKDYRWVSDSTTNVNTFRILSNTWFNQQMPLLEGRTNFLQYK